SEERSGHLLLRSLRASRNVGLQTGAVQARRAVYARPGQVDHVPGRKWKPGQTTLAIPSAWTEWKNDFRYAAATCGVGGRSLLHPFDDRKVEHARSGREPDEHRLHSRWFS